MRGTMQAALETPAPTDAARQLAWLGLLPFVGGALLVWLVDARAHPYVTLALSSYAALIVSFLGGIHWGLAMRQSAPAVSLLGWGVCASLLAWVAVLMPPNAGLVIEGALLVAAYLVDRRVYPREGLARWLTLRFRLTAIGALSCFVAAAGA